MRHTVKIIPILLLLTMFPHIVNATSSHTCPNPISAVLDNSLLYTDFKQQRISATIDIFNSSANWSNQGDISGGWACETQGFVVNQGSRVLLTCECKVIEEPYSDIRISGATTLIVPAGSQCSYEGNLTFSCE